MINCSVNLTVMQVQAPSSNGFTGTVYEEWKSRLPDSGNKNLPE